MNNKLLRPSVIFMILISSLLQPVYGQKSKNVLDGDLVYADLDRRLLQLWVGSIDKDSKTCRMAVKEIKSEWGEIQSLLSIQPIDYVNMPEFVKRVNKYISALDDCLLNASYSNLNSIAYHLMYEFRSLRQCLFKQTYSLDLLWETMDAYYSVKKTINDRMFDLKEWFEFEDQVNDFVCKWETYDLIPTSSVRKYYQGIKAMQHDSSKMKVKQCIAELFNAIESGFRSEFVLPCNDLGDALEELLRQYANSSTVMLM